MSGVAFVANTGQISTGTSAKTLLQIIAASNHRVVIKEWSIAFEGTSNSAAPIQVDVLYQSGDGTLSALTLVKAKAGDDETLEVTAKHTSTSEPTPGNVLFSTFVHPQTGRDWQARFSDEYIIPGGSTLGFRVTAGADVDAIVHVYGEE